MKSRGWISQYSMFNTSDPFSVSSNIESSLLDDYHYHESNKQNKRNEVESVNSSSRSLFLSKGSALQSFSSSLKNNMTNKEDDLTEVQSEDEEDEELIPCLGDPSTLTEEAKKQCSEKSTRKKHKGGLRVEDRCGKPLSCSVCYCCSSS